MNLYLKQKIFSFKDKYNIYDENENLVYHVDSELFTIGGKFHLYNANQEEEFFIKKKITFMLAKYEIYKNEQLYATINQEFSFLKPKLRVDSNFGEFLIKGEFMSRNFEITNNGSYFGGIQKKWLTWGDTYEINIPDSENASFTCALVIAIDNCLHNENN
jgi:uncharacterized protein YxjI